MHTCHAHGCSKRVPPRMFACIAHWRALRPALQRAIWREYRDGQEARKDPSLRYMAVQRLAVAELAFRPHDEEAATIATAYLAKAVEFQAAAIAAGQGDPLAGLLGEREEW